MFTKELKGPDRRKNDFTTGFSLNLRLKDPNFFRHDFSFKLLTHDAYLLQSSLLVNAMPLSFRCHCKKSPHYSNSRKKGSRSLIRNLSSRNINYLFGLCIPFPIIMLQARILFSALKKHSIFLEGHWQSC